MIDNGEEALRRLLGDVCAADDARSFAEGWGDVTESPARSPALHVTGSPSLPFAALDITPWPQNVYGVVDVTLRPADTWTWARVEERFGPFELTPVLESGAARFVATWEEPDLPATALLQAWVEGDRVASFTIRRDPRPATRVANPSRTRPGQKRSARNRSQSRLPRLRPE